MSVGARVYSRDNGQEYELTELLGSGAIGGVYRGRSRDGGEIAVKIPHARLPADLEQRFWQELGVLNKLGERSGGRYFPRAWRGTLADTGREVLCMELVRGTRLVKLAENTGGALEEKLALEAGLQYARMLEVLHGEDISCPDRKADDLYWDATTQRLTVLDWNVVKQGQDSMDPAQDLYIFGSLWYQLVTGSLPSPVDERLRRPLEEHPNWSKISFGLQMILRKALSPDPQWRYQSASELRKAIELHWSDFNRPAPNLLREARESLEKAKMPYGEGMAALYKAEGARFYNEQEADENVQIAIGRIKVLQASRDQALRLADLARRRQIGGAEAVWLEAQDLRKGLVELVENGSRRVRMVQYTAALQWLKVAEEAVAEDRAELLKLRRWQALADAGQAAMTKDRSLKQTLDPVDEIVKLLERGETSSAASQWARLTPRLEDIGWQENDEAGKHLWSLGHEATVLQAWEAAKKAEEAGQFEQAARNLEQAGQEADKVVYANRLLAVLGHTSTSLVAAATELHGRARVEESAGRLLRLGAELLERGDFKGAADQLQQGLALFAGRSGARQLYQQLEHHLRLARLLPKLDGVSQALPESCLDGDCRLRDWYLALDVIEKLAGEGDPEPFVRERVSAAIESMVGELDHIRKAPSSALAPEPTGRGLFGLGGSQRPVHKDWESLTSDQRALEIKKLIGRMREFDDANGPWLNKVMKWSAW